MSVRIDFENGDLESAGDLDDLAIAGEEITMLRLERMDPNHFWGSVALKDGTEIRLSIWSSKGKLSFTAEKQ